jgi:xanthine dehydrogenase accessory factor
VSTLFSPYRIAIRGGGDLGSGVAYRLLLSGFPVLITELAQPLLLRRAVCFGSAVIQNSIIVEGIKAQLAADLDHALTLQQDGNIPVLVDPDGVCLKAYSPAILIDARMRKGAPGPSPFSAAFTVGIGPGFSAPQNCNAIIETNRGHRLGRVIRDGAAEPDSRQPGAIMNHSTDRVIRAPAAGLIKGAAAIGAQLEENQLIAEVSGIPVHAPFKGILRGLVHDGVVVQENVKIADVDPRGEPSNAFTISDKSLAVGGGVLEAVLSSYSLWAVDVSK